MDIAQFYGKDPISDWQAVLGKEMPYTFGHFYRDSDDLQTAQQQTIRLFYPDILPGSTILDLGCGWGAPATLLERERGCRVTCVSNTPEQINYIRTVLGKKETILHDLETGFEQPGQWDIAMFMESMEHVKNKEKLLLDLRARTPRLIVRMDATRLPNVEDGLAFGDSMYMLRQETLMALLTSCGWKIEYIYDSRRASWPSLLHWKANIDRHFRGKIPRGNFHVLNELCAMGIARKEWWIWSSPLLNVLATRID